MKKPIASLMLLIALFITALTPVGLADPTAFTIAGGGGGGGILGVIHVVHSETAGTNGQALTTGARRTCTMNEILTDSTGSVTLSSNSIQSVPAGLYMVTVVIAVGDSSNSRYEAAIAFLNDGSNDYALHSTLATGGSSQGGMENTWTTGASIRSYYKIYKGTMDLSSSSNLTLQFRPSESDTPLAVNAGEKEIYHQVVMVKVMD